ncbi:YjcZ family sporulation protein [Sporolactobacillus pectinivorans]|nr:YjcZ family sporulation protein [Sporolactobacillus pectinivorans]
MGYDGGYSDGCGCHIHHHNNFALIVVLFILLIIVGATFMY